MKSLKDIADLAEDWLNNHDPDISWPREVDKQVRAFAAHLQERYDAICHECRGFGSCKNCEPQPQEKPPVMSQAYQPPCETPVCGINGSWYDLCDRCRPVEKPLVPVEELTLWSVEPLHDLQAKLNEVVKRLNILANK